MKKEFEKIVDRLIGLILLFLILGIAIYVLDRSSDSGLSGNLYVGICTLATGILAIIGVAYTILSNQKLKNKELLDAEKLKNKELLNELDQKSEWRKELMNIAAKPAMELEDVYRILASLRFLPKDESEVKQSNQKEFDKISTYIYKKLIKKISKFYEENKIDLDETLKEDFLNYRFNIRNSEEIRQYVKFLLKHHWEYNQSDEYKKEFMNKERGEFKKVRKQIDQIGKSGTFASTINKFKGFEDFEPIEEKIYIEEYRDKKYKNINKQTEAFLQKNKEDITITSIKINKNYCEKIIEIKYKRY